MNTKYSYLGAEISSCEKYRYWLDRRWVKAQEPLRTVMFIGLNPSTADDFDDDPTIRRCVRFAKDWGFNHLLMMNLFAFRATDPKQMSLCSDPVGPQNDDMLKLYSGKVSLIVAAWGVSGACNGRDIEVLKMLSDFNIHALKLTKHGQPSHPLYLSKDLKPSILFSAMQ
jgi:hypothetical protein